MLSDDGFERTFLAEGGCIFRAENVKIGFGAGFFQLFLFDQAAQLADLFGDAADALGDGFEFEGELAALSAEGFDLRFALVISASRRRASRSAPARRSSACAS
jgi:hypothetical protein